MGDGASLKAWVRAGMDFDRPPLFSFINVSDDHSILWLWLKPDGTCFMGDCTMRTWKVPRPVSIGYGTLYLHGLLDAGVGIEDAVARTMKRVPYLGGKIQIESLNSGDAGSIVEVRHGETVDMALRRIRGAA